MCFMLAHSSTHTSGVSDRLASSSYRARTLGMILGTVVSQLVDKPELRMTFDFNDEEQKELEWFQGLSRVNDVAGSLEDLKRIDERNWHVRPVHTATNFSAIKSEKQKPSSKPIITVVEEDDEENDLIPHAKPDSDTEDSDEDAAVAQRNRPKAPVYVIPPWKFSILLLVLEATNRNRKLLKIGPY